MLSAFLGSFLAAFVTLFIVIDPIMVTPIFAGLTRDDLPNKRLRVAFEAAVISAGILTLFGLAGNLMLKHLGISMDAFRTAREVTVMNLSDPSRDLRRFIAPHPVAGPLDARQWGLFLGLHIRRHLQQLDEILRALPSA